MPVRTHDFPLFLVLITVFGIDVHSSLLAQDDASWKDRLLKEAPPAWEKYRARAKRLQGTIERTTIRLSPKKEVMDKDRCEVKQTEGCAMFLVQGLGSGKPPDEKGLVMCINRRYGFEIRRKTSTSPWAVVNLDVDLKDGMNFTLGSPPNEAVVYWSTCPVDFNLIYNFSWGGINDPKFTVHRVTPVPRGDIKTVKVEFDYRSPSDKPVIPSLKGWVLYDPQRFWVIHEYNTQVEWETTNVKAAATVVYEYEEAADGFPLPKRVTQRFTPVNGVDREHHYEFNLKEADVSESDFTLSAFGLPEPPEIESTKPMPWYLVLAGIGMVCLGVFFFLRSRAKRAGG